MVKKAQAGDVPEVHNGQKWDLASILCNPFTHIHRFGPQASLNGTGYYKPVRFAQSRYMD